MAMTKEKYTSARQRYFESLHIIQEEFQVTRQKYIDENKKFDKGQEVVVEITSDVGEVTHVEGVIDSVYIDAYYNLAYTVKDNAGNFICLSERTRIK